MFRIAVCDDMPEFAAQVVSALEQWQDRPAPLHTEVFTDADALLSAHAAKPFDIILLDVIMPLLSGLDAARELRQQDKTVKIVFLTSSPEFAVESYCVKANNYLLKPLDTQRLYACMAELTEEIRSSEKAIIVKSAKAVHRIPVRSIEYIEAQNKRVFFSLVDGNNIVGIEPLYTYENMLLLSEGFFKCSRSYIVNLHFIDTYTSKEIRMRSGCRISISRSCHKEFESAYFEVLFGKEGGK